MSDDYHDDFGNEIDYVKMFKSTPTDRECLYCDTKFLAENKYIRVCKKCKKSSDYYHDDPVKVHMT